MTLDSTFLQPPAKLIWGFIQGLSVILSPHLSPCKSFKLSLSMEILSSSFLPNPNFFSSISFLSPTTTSLATLSKKTPYKFRKTHLKSSPNPPFLTNSPLQNNKISHINARFGRPTKRRNSLRKKLRESDSQVREYPQKVIDPVHHFVDNQVNDSNLGSNNLEIESGKIGSSQIDYVSNNLEKSRQFGESVLWDKLEGWVEQYKKDIEFWGIGSKTIFTVFQDSDGNVERVLVDEDEIMRRSGVEPLYYREESEFEVFDEVNLRLSHAKFLARELESGKNVIPKNSSVTKFVVSGEKSGFVSRIRSVFVPRISLAKVSKVGIAVVCGFVFVWVIKKLFTVGGEETERTSFEKEMLRRKIKSRMEKEKLRKGTVQVMEEPADPPIVITERPLIDKEVVLNSIREAKGLNNSLVVLDAGGTRETASVDMDTKIHEIQMMARHARKIERGEESPSEGGGVDEQIPNEMQSVEKDTVEGHEELMIDESEKQASNALPSIVEIANAAEEHAGVDMDFMNNLLSEQSAETRVFNGIKKRSGDAEFTSEKDSEGNEDVESSSISNGRVIDDNKSHIDSCIQSHDSSSSSNLTEGIQSLNLRSQLNSSKKAPLRRKPKIIRSVKEAREYLLQKQDQQSQVGDIPTTAAVKDEEMDSYFRQRSGEDGKAPESFDVDRIVDPVSAPKAFDFYAEKRNELSATSTNGFQNETESGLKKIRTSDRPTAENSDVDTALHLGKTMKTSDMLNPNDSRQRSDHIPGEKDSCGASQEVPLLAEQSSEEVDKLYERPKPSDLSEISDLASGKNASHVASKSTEESGVLHENVVHDANLQNKVYLSNDGINGTVNLTEFYETFIPGVVGRDLNGSASVEYASEPLEIKDEDKYRKNHVESKFSTAETFQDSESSVDDREGELLADKEKWLEKNFHEVEPIVNKIGSGFRNNYNVAREKIKELDAGLDLMTLRSIKDSTELEWMQDDKLREIVFRVRDNELAGRDPFHSMNPEDKAAFLKGLESKVEKENQKLSILHEWIHSNIENVDYGAGIVFLKPKVIMYPFPWQNLYFAYSSSLHQWSVNIVICSTLFVILYQISDSMDNYILIPKWRVLITYAI